jgi:enoyl-CoA hydratase/carnithine racemase
MSDNETPPVRIVRDGAVGTVLLDRPARFNALDLATRRALAAAFVELTNDTSVRAIVVSGGDQVFAAGADLKLLADKGPAQVQGLDFPGLWRPVAECPKPVVAAVAGLALGAGCELAMMCDVIVADETARFGQPEIKVGIMPGAGGTQRLVRALGKPVANLMLLTGDLLPAARAAALGLVSELVAPGGAQARAQAIAAKIAAMPPLAVAAVKRTIAAGADMPLATAMALENREFLLLFDTADQTEGMAAFLEKRAPIFEGR